MRVTVLMENTRGREDLFAEHGLCLLLKTRNHTLLADTGQSERTWENADRMGIDLSAVDTVVLSHGHYDHTGGLPGFCRRNSRAAVWVRDEAFGSFYNGERYIGMSPEIADLPGIRRVTGDVSEIDGELSLFSGLSGTHASPRGNAGLCERIGGTARADRFCHEQALVVREGDRRFLISGCAHNGILNILDRFRSLYGRDADAVISGFHLMKNGDYTGEETDEIRRTAEELAKRPGTKYYTGHCTGEASRILSGVLGERLRVIRTGDEWEL